MKKIYLFTILLVAGIQMKAQNFLKFDAMDNNGVKALTGLNHRPGKALLTVLVSEDFNLENVSIDVAVDPPVTYTEIPTDFTEPRQIVVTNQENQQSKKWTITFKKVRCAEGLPFTLEFSEEFRSTHWDQLTTKGWAAAEIDDTEANTKIARFGTSPASLIVALKENSGKVSYDLNVVGQAAFNGTFNVWAKEHEGAWTPLALYDSGNPMAVALPQSYEHVLTPATRFIKWEYAQRNGQNVNLNAIQVEAATETSVEETGIEPKPCYNAGETLYLNCPQEIRNVELFDQAGRLVMKSCPEGNTIAMKGLKGCYGCRITYKNGNTYTQFIFI